jgi:hypothetical protein
MPIEFFLSSYKNSSNKTIFGLCDDTTPITPSTRPAYIDENDENKWIAEVVNNNEYAVDFYAIDNCVEIRRPNGAIESRCDGMLYYNNKLIFVELKDRNCRGWLYKGTKQLTTTYNIFRANYDITQYSKIEAYVCNRQRPSTSPVRRTLIQKFKTETGLELKSGRKIILQ